MTSFKLLERIVKDLDEKDMRVEAFGGLHDYAETAEDQLYFYLKNGQVMAKFQGNPIKVDRLECMQPDLESNTLLVLNDCTCITWSGTKIYLQVVGYGMESEVEEQLREFMELDANIGIMEMEGNVRPYSLYKIEGDPNIYYCRAILEKLDPKELILNYNDYDHADVYHHSKRKCCFNLGTSYLSFELDKTDTGPKEALVTRFAYEKFDRSWYRKPIRKVKED